MRESRKEEVWKTEDRSMGTIRCNKKKARGEKVINTTVKVSEQDSGQEQTDNMTCKKNDTVILFSVTIQHEHVD